MGLIGLFYYLPVGAPRFDGAVMEALELAKWYACENASFVWPGHEGLIPSGWIAPLLGENSLAARESSIGVENYE